MDEMETIQNALKEIQAERADLKDEMAKLAVRDSALAQAEAGLLALLGQVPEQTPANTKLDSPVTNGSYPRMGEAVQLVLRQRPRKRMNAPTLVRRLKEAGLLDPKLRSSYGSVLEAAKRLARTKPDIHRVNVEGRAYFVYRPPKKTP
jgi:hypothetical protein